MNQYQLHYQKELEELDRIIKCCELSLKKAPEGKLRISNTGKYPQYYHRKNTKDINGSYLSKKDYKSIKGLAQKEYDIKLLNIAIKQKELVHKCMMQMGWNNIDNLYLSYPLAKQKYIQPYVLTDEEYVKQWEEQKANQKQEYLRCIHSGKCTDYEVKKFHMMEMSSEEGIKTDRGELVRSKSEKIIADKLYHLDIPYVYEQPLYLKKFGYIFPDFVMLNVRERREYVGEHFGMMDDLEYVDHAMRKIETYIKHDIYIGINLIVTHESKNHPLSIQALEKMVHQFLL